MGEKERGITKMSRFRIKKILQMIFAAFMFVYN